MKYPRRGKFLLSVATLLVAGPAAAQTLAPRFEVEMLWPKPLPNRWILGSATGIAIDSRDHIFVVNHGQNFNTRTETAADLPTPGGECCKAAPSVLEFDANGTLVASWGGPNAAYQWPTTITGVAVDKDGNVWIGGTGGSDSHILKFSRDGKFLATIGKFTPPPAVAPPAAVDTAYQGVSGRGRAGAADTAGRAGGRGTGGRGGGRGGGGRGAPIALPGNSTSMETFGGPAGISFNAKGDEAYVADGSRNRRVAVVDVATGAIKRYWGAYGSQPGDGTMPAYSATAPASRQFSTVTCAEVAKDGMVYVCDRGNNRVQVFKGDGSFVKEKIIAPKTPGEGSVADVTFSRDAAQKYLYVADGMNNRIWVLDRQSLDVLTSFGDGGRIPGAFNQLHSIATDSKGNLYTVETGQGKRVQKFLFKGVGVVPAQPKAIVWPGVGK
jgi:DNA-binding beta-propeller fold protein YncE